MSNLFNYINKSLIGAVIEGYEYSIATGHVDSVTSICYVVDRVEMLMNAYTHPVQVYITIKIDPAYTTYTSIDASNLLLTQVVYIPANLIEEVTEFPETPPLISQEEGLLGANIKGYKYNIGTGVTDSALTTCRVIDRVRINVNNVLTDVYVCVLYTGTTGTDKIYIPIHLLSEVVSFGIIDPGLPSVLRYTAMNFVQDATVTTILFKDVTTGNILRAEPINSIQAVANGVDIRIQRTGGEEIFIDALDITTTYIDGVLVSAVLATALAELNALFANVGGVGNPPTITGGASRTINLTYSFTLNLAITGTDIVALTLDLSTTGTVPVGHLAIPVGNNTLLIGGSLLPVGSYTFYITAINYYGAFTQAVTLVVAVPPFSNTMSFYHTAPTAYFRDDVVGQENNNPFYRASGPTGNPWSVFGWAKTTQTAGWTANNCRPLLNFGGDGTTGGRLKILYKRQNSYNHDFYIWYGDGTDYVRGWKRWGNSTGTWFSWAVVWDGTDSTNISAFKLYINGVQTGAFTLTGLGWSGSIEYASGNNDTKLMIGKVFHSYANGNMAYIDDVAFWNSDESANISAFHNSGTPIDLNFLYSPFSYYRFGDVPTDITGYPTLTNEGSTGNDLTAYNGTVADYVTDTPP